MTRNMTPDSHALTGEVPPALETAFQAAYAVATERYKALPKDVQARTRNPSRARSDVRLGFMLAWLGMGITTPEPEPTAPKGWDESATGPTDDAVAELKAELMADEARASVALDGQTHVWPPPEAQEDAPASTQPEPPARLCAICGSRMRTVTEHRSNRPDVTYAQCVNRKRHPKRATVTA